MTPPLTPTQTVGPFFHDALLRRDACVATEVAGSRVRVVGAVYDGAGNVVPDALIETWQGSCFTRTGTESGGGYELVTGMPAPVADRPMDAPHLDVIVLARGVLNQLVTRIYFPDEPANATDPVLRLVPDERRATLVATREPEAPAGADPTFRFDIVLQGANETVFFDVR